MYPPTQNAQSVPLGIAAQEGHIETVERLLEGKANVNYKDKVRSTICQYAYMYVILVITSALIQWRILCCIFSTQLGHTALFFASLNGHRKIVQMLLQQCADVNISNTVCTV